MVGCGPAAMAISMFCRKELDPCERQTLTVHQLQGQGLTGGKRALVILRALTDADAELEDLLRACWLAVSDHDQPRSGCSYQQPALSQETT